ncbi:MAG: cytochrome c-type biogenesis protein [Methyloligellaceae bacterium]
MTGAKSEERGVTLVRGLVVVRCLFLCLSLVLAVVLTAPVAQAVQPDEVLDDTALEARARDISAELRCLVCQNQSIDDSNAPLARDLRILVRERLVAGDSNEQAVEFIVARYGEFVLLKPRFGIKTLLLWAAPILFLIVAFIVVYLSFRGQSGRTPVVATPNALSSDEQERLDKILKGSD